MRDPKRIKAVMDLTTELWSKYPDMRFNQLMDYLQETYARENDLKIEVYEKMKFGKGSELEVMSYKYDLFNVEDDKWIQFLIDQREKM